MNLTAVSPFFIVADLGASIAYYVDKLGFQVDFQGPPDDVYYAGVSREGKGTPTLSMRSIGVEVRRS